MRLPLFFLLDFAAAADPSLSAAERVTPVTLTQTLFGSFPLLVQQGGQDSKPPMGNPGLDLVRPSPYRSLRAELTLDLSLASPQDIQVEVSIGGYISQSVVYKQARVPFSQFLFRSSRENLTDPSSNSHRHHGRRRRSRRRVGALQPCRHATWRPQGSHRHHGLRWRRSSSAEHRFASHSPRERHFPGRRTPQQHRARRLGGG